MYREHLCKPCVLYTGYLDRNGYGYKSQTSKGERFVHRQVFLDAYGYLPPVVRHACDNPTCIEPTHLIGGTQADNMKDMKKRQRRRGITAVYGETHGCSILTEDQVKEIKARYLPRKITQKMLASEYGVSQWTIRAITQGRLWKHL